MKPGDFIEWTYVNNSKIVLCGEMLWSFTMNRYVPIGGDKLHLLISNVCGIITWMNNDGLFHMCEDNTASWTSSSTRRSVVPRVKTL